MGHTWAEMDPVGAAAQAERFAEEHKIQARGYTAPLKSGIDGVRIEANYHTKIRGCTGCGAIIHDIELHEKSCPVREK